MRHRRRSNGLGALPIIGVLTAPKLIALGVGAWALLRGKWQGPPLDVEAKPKGTMTPPSRAGSGARPWAPSSAPDLSPDYTSLLPSFVEPPSLAPAPGTVEASAPAPVATAPAAYTPQASAAEAYIAPGTSLYQSQAGASTPYVTSQPTTAYVAPASALTTQQVAVQTSPTSTQTSPTLLTSPTKLTAPTLLTTSTLLRRF